MKESTLVKGGFWGGIIGAVTGLLGCAFGALSYFGLGPDVVRDTLGGWYHILFPVLMAAFGFLFGFSVRHLAARHSARKAQAAHDAALAAVESERYEAVAKAEAERDAAVAKAEAERDAAIAERDAATRRTVAAEVERDEALAKAEADRDAEVAKAEAERAVSAFKTLAKLNDVPVMICMAVLDHGGSMILSESLSQSIEEEDRYSPRMFDYTPKGGDSCEVSLREWALLALESDDGLLRGYDQRDCERIEQALVEDAEQVARDRGDYDG